MTRLLVISITGGRDIRGGPILSVSTSDEVDMDLLMDMSMPELTDMLAYFTFVPRY